MYTKQPGLQNFRVFPITIQEQVLTMCGLEEMVMDEGSDLVFASEACASAVLGIMPNMFFVTNLNGLITAANSRSCEALGYEECELEGHTIQELFQESDVPRFKKFFADLLLSGKESEVEFTLVSKEGVPFFCSLSGAAIDGESRPKALLFFAEDLNALKLTEKRLMEAQKLETVGRLVAGVAHEINTPVQYIGGNTEFLRTSLEELDLLRSEWEKLGVACAERPELEEILRGVNACKEDIDLEYLQEEIPKCLTQTLEGVGSVSQIVASLKVFAHPGSPEKELHSLAAVVQNIVTVTHNEWKYVATLETEFDESLGSILCYRSELSQVIANIIINAAHALEEQKSAGTRSDLGLIRITGQQRGEFAEITITDNGPGIPKEIQCKIFDRFFTTKKVGKGTGQGLSIAHSIITDRHGGQIELDSRPGHTSFIIRIPIEPTLS